jgi:hypothetical protein
VHFSSVSRQSLSFGFWRGELLHRIGGSGAASATIKFQTETLLCRLNAYGFADVGSILNALARIAPRRAEVLALANDRNEQALPLESFALAPNALRLRSGHALQRLILTFAS